ncbi:MAG: DNA-directed DNA polymerase I [Thaumarchaeota archaeon]|nr:DNA-directed DNA polymerase I [Candidatus Calditenuaceae archaeon]MDW8187096.1 DNA-directed DNA polymerase I [Nitrososphaerota archaeon]
MQLKLTDVLSSDFEISRRAEGRKTEETWPDNLRFLLSAAYDGTKGRAYLKFYNPRTRKVETVEDATGHLPYCYVKLDEASAGTALKEVMERVVRLERAKLFDALREQEIELVKVVTKDPLAIGGRSYSVREKVTAWEADIPYHLNYLMDRGLVVGEPYLIDQEGGLSLYGMTLREAVEVAKRVKSVEDRDLELVAEWIRLLEADQPDLPVCGIDIEVANPIATRVPDPSKAEDKIVAIAIRGSNGRREVYLLMEGSERTEVNVEGYRMLSYGSEREMLEDFFAVLDSEYAVIATFNGDDFDLPYLRNRAERIGVPKEKVPIVTGREGSSFVRAVHVDLYSFFLNKSIQIYAFDNKYREFTLEGISQALLNKGKVKIEGPISSLSTAKLAEYCLQDAELVYDLLTHDDRLVLRLIMVLCRISRLPPEDLCRHGVSGWIKNLLYFEHRRRRWLIPRKEEILEVKGGTATKAIIEGKKYRGAIVVDPVPGIHFDVKVVDFASLYPSVLARWNLSYETIRCPHESCKKNMVPETPHWVCAKNRGLQSSIIGALKEVRVGIYKPRSSDRNLPEGPRRWYDVVQKAIKVFLNASYGVFGFEEFPLYCPPLAESTAAIGRHVFKSAIEKVRELGAIIVYGDTDSLFLKGANGVVLESLIKWASTGLGLDLEPDKQYVYIVFSARKKNYLGLTTKGVVDVKGLTGKKRHIPDFIREAFNSMLQELSTVKTPEDLEMVKKHIADLIKGWHTKLRKREFELSELAFSVMLSKQPESYTETTPPHVKAAKILRQHGVHVTSGDIIRYVKTKDKLGVAPLHPNVKVLKDQVDVDKYIEYMRSTFEQVLDSLDMDFDVIVGVGSLEQFFA